MGTRSAAAALAALLLAGPSIAQERKPSEEALFALRAAWAEGDEQDQVEAIRKGGEFRDLPVVEELTRGLHASSPAVREAALVALGRGRVPQALQALLNRGRTGWRFRENEELVVQWIRALGRHGDPSALATLAARPPHEFPRAVGAARVAAMARIRTRESLVALLEAQRQAAASTRPRRRGAAPLLAAEFRAALAELTGIDKGTATVDWQSWWKAKGSEFAVPGKRPAIAPEHRARWEAFWGEPWAEGGTVAAPAPPGRPWNRVEGAAPEEIAAAVAGLKAALLDEDGDAAAAGIEEFAPVDDPSVLALLVSGLGWPRPAVRNACVRALGWLGTPAALEALLRFHRSSPAVRGDEDLHVLVLKSMGRHGSPDSIPEFADGTYRDATFAVGRARILGLATVRRKESIEAVFAALATGGARTKLAPRPGEPRFMEPARLALQVLTCQDFGNDAEAWRKWWAESEKGFEVPRERPELPPELRRTWEEYWGVAYR